MANRSPLRLLGLAARWLTASAVLAPFTWGVVGGVCYLPFADSARDALVGLLAAAVFGPLYAVVVIALLTVGYMPVFAAWPWFAQLVPRAECSRMGLAFSSAAFSLPAAGIVAYSRADRGWAGFDLPTFGGWLAMAAVAGTLAIFLPRILFTRLRPGAFSAGAA